MVGEWSGRSALIGVVLVIAAACQHLNFRRGNAPAPQAAVACVSSTSELPDLDLGLEPELEERLKTAMSGALHLEQSAKRLDDRFASVCESLSRELGVKKPEVRARAELGRRTELACKKSIDQLVSLKESSGAGLSVEAKAFTCGVNPSDFGACAKGCDPHLPPGNLQVACAEGKLQGRCSGKCTGECGHVNSAECAATCLGECGGSCSSGFYGKCGGRCVGTCDMGNINGKCGGNCEGKCLSEAAGSCEGTCKGKCTGNCVREVKRKPCDGTCRGECDGDVTAAVCAEVLPPPEMTPECVAMCMAQMTAKLQCRSDHVGVTLYRADKEGEAKRIQGALSRRMRDILEIGDGMKLPFEEAASRIAESLVSVSEDFDGDEPPHATASRCLEEAQERQRRALAAMERLAATSAEIFEATRH